MGTTKSEQFTAEQNAIAIIAKAAGHPARIAILEFLANTNACICGDITEEIGLAQSTVSRHLKELKEAGLIKGTVEGTAVCYCINEQALQKLQLYFSHLSARLRQGKNECC